MVFETQAHGYYFTQEERVQFSASLEPPPNTHIWIAPHQGRRRAAFHVRALINPVKNSGVEVVTWVMNQLVFQLVRWKGDNRSRIDQAPFCARQVAQRDAPCGFRKF
jgi:hypothetical protein